MTVIEANHLYSADGYENQQRFEERIAFSAPTPSAPAFNPHVEGQAAPVAAAMQVTNISSTQRSLAKSLSCDASFECAATVAAAVPIAFSLVFDDVRVAWQARTVAAAAAEI